MGALSEKTWVGVGLGLRLLMAGALAASVQLKYANHADGFYELQSYTYAVVTAGVGALGFVLQAMVAVYLLCRMCRQRAPGVGALNLSMYADMVASAVMASGVGAGFGATNDARQMAGGRWAYWEQGGERRDLDGYYDRGAIAVVFLLAGMLLSMGASVVSARLRVWAAEGPGHRQSHLTPTTSPSLHFPASRSFPTPKARHESTSIARDGGRAAVVGVAAPQEVRRAVHAVLVQRARRAPQLPRLPRLALRRPLPLRGPRRRGLLGRLPPPRRRRARRRPPPPLLLLLRGALRRAGPGLPHPRRLARLRLPPRAPPPRGGPPPPALPRQPPPRLRRRAGGVRRGARALLPRPRLLRAPLRARRGRLQGLLVLPRRRRRGVPVAVVGGGGVRARGRLMGLPRRDLLHGLRALPGHLLPPDPADGGVRARVREVRRRGHRAAAPPADQGAAQEDQPPLPKVHSRQPRARLRQPVRRAARHHQAARRRQSRHRRRARAVLDQPGGGPSGVPAQRGEDHAQDAGDDERGGGVARRRHRARLRQRPGEPGPGPAPHRGLPGAGQRLPRGRRRRVRQRRRRRQPQRRVLPRRSQVRPVPGKQHLLPEAAGAGDVPGEQPGRDHGVRLRGGPGVAARALHDRVLARHVAARQDGWHLLNLMKLKCLHLPLR